MSSLVHHFLVMAFNNGWANYRLLKACSQQSQADFVATRTSFFPSLKATLNHILTVDWYYVDALERRIQKKPPNREAWQFFEPEEPFDQCADLAIAQRKVDLRLIEFCRSCSEQDLEAIAQVPRANGIHSEPLVRLLAHLFQHQIHHRGQVHAMLAGTSIAPPQLDEFFCANDAYLRIEDFQALGFSESEIWGDRPLPPTQPWAEVESK
jgi:uncharacterized damage-inducible protein DinB